MSLLTLPYKAKLLLDLFFVCYSWIVDFFVTLNTSSDLWWLPVVFFFFGLTPKILLCLHMCLWCIHHCQFGCFSIFARYVFGFVSIAIYIKSKFQKELTQLTYITSYFRRWILTWCICWWWACLAFETVRVGFWSNYCLFF